MKRTFSLLIAALVCISAFAQSINTKDLSEIRGSFVKDPATIAARNALSKNGDIASLAATVTKDTKIDNHFKYEVKALPSAPNQYTSGRCWLFTSLNSVRHYAMEKYNVKDFRFSPVYCSFWDLFEKYNTRFEDIIATAGKPIDDREVEYYFTEIRDGGEWHSFLNVMEKYGLVPESAMPETIHSNNTANMRSILNTKMRKEGLEIRNMMASGASETQARAYKIGVMKDIYRIMALCMGEPPVEFTWNYEDNTGAKHTLTTTPLEFRKSIIPADYEANHIMVMNDPTHEYYKVHRISGHRNVIEAREWVYLNLPPEEAKAAALQSIKNGEALVTTSDWRKGLYIPLNYMNESNFDYESLFGMSFAMDKEARIKTRFSTPAHLMLLTACDTDENDKPLKWKLFNSSFSAGAGDTLIFTDEWWDEYMFRIILERKYLSPKAQQAIGQEGETFPLYIQQYFR